MSDDLRDQLSELRERLVPQRGEATFEGLQQHRRKRQRRQRAGAALAALLIAVGSTAFVIHSFGGSAPTPAAPTPAVATNMIPEVGRSIQVGPHGQTSDMAAGFGKLWVAVYGVPGGEGIDRNALVEVDPQSIQVERTIPVPAVPTWETGGGGLIASGDYLWIAASTSDAGHDVATLLRIDPNTGESTTYTWSGATGFAGVASDGTSLWLLGQADGHPVVTRFDPGTAVFSDGVQLAGDAGRHIQAVPGEVIVSEYTWAQGVGPCLSLASIEPSTTPALRAEFPAHPCSEENTVGLVGLPAIDGDVWNLYKGAFTTIDPATAEPRPVESPSYRPLSPRSDPIVSDSGVWFGDYSGGNGSQPGILSRFDPTTGTVTPSDVRIGWSVGVAEFGRLWAVGWDGTLTEIQLTRVGQTSPEQSTAPPPTGGASITESVMLDKFSGVQCTATIPSIVQPGEQLGLALTLENVSDTTRDDVTSYGPSFPVQVQDGDGRTWDTADLMNHSWPASIPQPLRPGGIRQVQLQPLAVEFPGPLTVTPTCLGQQMPAIQVDVANPGGTPIPEDAVTRAVAETSGLFEACAPTATTSTTGTVRPPDDPAQSLEVGCAAQVTTSPGFAVVTLAMSSPADLPTPGIPEGLLTNVGLATEQGNAETVVWRFVVTPTQVLPVESAMSIRTRPADAMDTEYEVSTKGWTDGGSSRCGGAGGSGGGDGSSATISFYGVCGS